jgi:hypothetical protein
LLEYAGNPEVPSNVADLPPTVLFQIVPEPEYEAAFPASKFSCSPFVTTDAPEIFGALLTITVKVSVAVAPKESRAVTAMLKVLAGIDALAFKVA